MESLIVKKYDHDDDRMWNDLVDFAEQATEDGYINNSIERMKLDVTDYWVVYYNDKIIHVNGVHDKPDGWWMIRMTTLHQYHGLIKQKRPFGISSMAIRYTVPTIINWSQSIEQKPIYFSTNIDNLYGKWQTRADRHSQRFCDMNVFSHVDTRKINGRMQRVYRVNIPEFKTYYNQMIKKADNQIDEIILGL